MRMISSKRPVYAGWSDDLCFIAFLLNKLFGFMGGESPFFLFVEDKCHIDTGTGTTTTQTQ